MLFCKEIKKIFPKLIGEYLNFNLKNYIVSSVSYSGYNEYSSIYVFPASTSKVKSSKLTTLSLISRLVQTEYII